MKLQSFLINMVYWMFAFTLLKYSKTATEKVAFFLSLTVWFKHSMSIAQQLRPIYNTAVHKNKSYVALNVVNLFLP